MKDIRVDGAFQRVFVLTESEDRIVYIPLKHLHRTDYDRLVAIEKAAGRGEMLTEMRKTVLDNGKNALVLYDSIIQVLKKNKERSEVDGVPTGERVLKADEQPSRKDQEEEKEAPRRGPGRPPGAKNKKKEA